MKTLFRNTLANNYKVEMDEIITTGPDGVDSSGVLIKEYIHQGDRWLFIWQRVYTGLAIEELTKSYIEKLGYWKGE